MKLTHVPYRNIAQYGPDLIAGTVQLGFQWFPNVSGPIGAKGASALAVAGDVRLAALPDVPTTTEAGLPQYKVDGWFALAAPAGTTEAGPGKAQQGAGGRYQRSCRSQELRKCRRRADRIEPPGGQEIPRR